MCHLSMFIPNPMYTSDKIVVKHISVKETLLKLKETLLQLDLEPKSQGHSKNQNNKQGNKNIPSLINRAGIHLVTVMQLMSQTGYE